MYIEKNRDFPFIVTPGPRDCALGKLRQANRNVYYDSFVDVVVSPFSRYGFDSQSCMYVDNRLKNDGKSTFPEIFMIYVLSRMSISLESWLSDGNSLKEWQRWSGESVGGEIFKAIQTRQFKWLSDKPLFFLELDCLW